MPDLFPIEPAPAYKNPCVRKYGEGPVGKRCKSCARLYGFRGRSKTYWKCELRGDSHGPGTDHRVNWRACAKYEAIDDRRLQSTMNYKRWGDEYGAGPARFLFGFDPAVPGEDFTVCYDIKKGEIITMPTRCKFVCAEVTKTFNRHEGRFLYTARLIAVMEGSEENKKFFAYTPVGELKVQLVTGDIFTPGQEYYLDISEAQPVQAPATSER